MFKAAIKGKTRGKSLKECSCLVPISVGQALHEGEKLEATVKLINATFGSCIIVIADTLYRHTTPRSNEETESDIRRRTKELGTEWHKRNAETLKALEIDHKVLSWDEYLQSEKYAAKKQFVEKLYTEDSKFKRAVDGAVGKFIKRHKTPNSLEVDMEQAFKDSLEYLKEESAVWLLWAESETPNFLIYPNKLYEPLSYLRQFFPDGSDVVLQPLIISFQTVQESITLQQPRENGSNSIFPPQPQSFQPGFFQLAPVPVNAVIPKEELVGFIESHMKIMYGMLDSESLDLSLRQDFATCYMAQMSNLLRAFAVTDKSSSDTSSDSSDSDPSDMLGTTSTQERKSF